LGNAKRIAIETIRYICIPSHPILKYDLWRTGSRPVLRSRRQESGEKDVHQDTIAKEREPQRDILDARSKSERVDERPEGKKEKGTAANLEGSTASRDLSIL